MRVAQFLILMLEAHAETLRRLSALLGQEELLEMLDSVGDDEDSGKTSIEIDTEGFLPPEPGARPVVAYTELEGAVREMSLPEPLEFYLWAYPPYRAYIESALDLDARFPGPGGELGAFHVEGAVHQAEKWLERLPLAEPVAALANRASHVTWLRFRSESLKRVGRRPIGPVY